MFSGDRVSVWEGEEVLGMCGGDDCITVNVLNATELYV